MDKSFNKSAGLYKNDITKVTVIQNMTSQMPDLLSRLESATGLLEMAQPSVLLMDKYPSLTLRMVFKDDTIDLILFNHEQKIVQDSDISIDALNVNLGDHIFESMKKELFSFEHESLAETQANKIARIIADAAKPPEPKVAKVEKPGDPRLS